MRVVHLPDEDDRRIQVGHLAAILLAGRASQPNLEDLLQIHPPEAEALVRAAVRLARTIVRVAAEPQPITVHSHKRTE